ncbi:MAG: beta-ketoacyl-[Prevotella sp.]|nr:beta-ketoacyl-[acyl-carrier-protein] synthase family protein [Prevotella sp.]
MNPSIVITGEGIVCAIGLDKDAVLASLRERRTGIGTMRYLRSVHQELPVGEVPLSDEEMRRQLGLVDAQLVNRTTLMGMLAVRQALADAAIDVSTVKRQPLRLVLVSGTTVAGMDITERFFRELQDSDEHLRCLLSHSAGSSTRLIADYFGIFGEYTTISTACSSAANALILGANLLKAGQADIVVAGGTEALSVFHLNGFNSLMILDHEQCRPFDET